MSRRKLDALARLRNLPDDVLELLVDVALDELNQRDGAHGDEADDYDGCEAEDVAVCPSLGAGPGDPDDAETDVVLGSAPD